MNYYLTNKDSDRLYILAYEKEQYRCEIPFRELDKNEIKWIKKQEEDWYKSAQRIEIKDESQKEFIKLGIKLINENWRYNFTDGILLPSDKIEVEEKCAHVISMSPTGLRHHITVPYAYIKQKSKNHPDENIIDFAVWYSGMERSKVESAYELFKKEKK